MRRTKDLIAHKLPPKFVQVQEVRLDPGSRDVYDTLHLSVKHCLEAALASGGEGQMLSMYTTVLECILRLRQAADAAILVPAERVEAARALLKRVESTTKKMKTVKLSKKEIEDLFAALTGALTAAAATDDMATDNECCVCTDALTEVSVRVLKSCRHAFCADCIARVSGAAAATCPLCRTSFTQGDILSHEALTIAAKDAAADADPGTAGAKANVSAVAAIASTPPKITALLHAIAEMHEEGPELKCVVFSQFTGMLNIIAAKLREAGIGYGRLDGSMSSAARKQAVSGWKAPNSAGAPSVMLISTKAGGTGLNLTEANRAFLMDVWWNSAVDDQAMDRIHRLGQTRPVKVVRYIAERSIEGRILELQRRKAALGKGALHRLSAEEARVARAQDLKSLFDL